jgi:hypothetical protein
MRNIKIKSVKRVKSEKIRQLTIDEQKPGRQAYWTKAGFISELHCVKKNKTNFKHNFIMTIITLEGELERIECIEDEFVCGFKNLYNLVPEVKVFSHARFKKHYYGSVG